MGMSNLVLPKIEDRKPFCQRTCQKLGIHGPIGYDMVNDFYRESAIDYIIKNRGYVPNEQLEDVKDVTAVAKIDCKIQDHIVDMLLYSTNFNAEGHFSLSDYMQIMPKEKPELKLKERLVNIYYPFFKKKFVGAKDIAGEVFILMMREAWFLKLIYKTNVFLTLFILVAEKYGYKFKGGNPNEKI